MTLPVYLIGYMGAGKTTVGRMAAQRLGWHFVDLDDAFAEINSMSTAAYIRRFGIERFRHQEKDCVEQLSELPIQKVIYATGGGYPCWEDNMECLKELGSSVYLRWSNAHLAQRLWLTDLSLRPVLQAKTEQELHDFVAWQMSARENFYRQADYIVEASAIVGEKLTETNDADIAEYLYQLITRETNNERH